MRNLRADPIYRQKELDWQRQYYRRNRAAIRYVAKCRQAGIDMTLAKAREILCQPERSMKRAKPNLPITLLAAEATVYADNYLARMKRPPFYLGDGRQIDKAPLDPDIGYQMAKAWFRATGPAHVLNLSQLVELATVHGELAAHEVLVELMSERQDRGEPLGPVLTAYDIRLKHTPFQPHRGWSRTNFVADLILFNLVLELHERFGLTPTRHQPPKPNSKPSACSIAAAAAQKAEIGRGEERAFQQLWRKFKPAVLPEYQWPDWGRRLG
jgi:hypothetical protein